MPDCMPQVSRASQYWGMMHHPWWILCSPFNVHLLICLVFQAPGRLHLQRLRVLVMAPDFPQAQLQRPLIIGTITARRNLQDLPYSTFFHHNCAFSIYLQFTALPMLWIYIIFFVSREGVASGGTLTAWSLHKGNSTVDCTLWTMPLYPPVAVRELYQLKLL